MKSCPISSGVLIFQRINKAPGFKILGIGDSNKKITNDFGIQLIIEKILEK